MYNYVNYIYERVKHVRELKFKINDKETKIYNLIIRKISTSPTFPFFIKYLMRITTISFFFRHTNKSKLHKKSTINVLVINSLKHGGHKIANIWPGSIKKTGWAWLDHTPYDIGPTQPTGQSQSKSDRAGLDQALREAC